MNMLFNKNLRQRIDFKFIIYKINSFKKNPFKL